ncbi:MAG: hypothetical protein OEM29_03170 [Thermoplasmata archaeon]|nr:hypothetical protein [Thermoplasmata archaeon]
MKKDDDDKWEFYENEFGIYRNMREQMAKLWNIDLKEKANWVEPEMISRINYPTQRRRDQSKEK